MLVFAVIVFTALHAHMSIAAEEINLKGTFQWVKQKKETPHKLNATFTSTGTNQWNCVFHFDWSKKPRLYTGTATGKLTNGKIEGIAKNENKKRTFTFKGTFKNGKMTGTHTEIKTRNDTQRVIDTGTLTLEVAD
jgi:hypothetical protein